MFAACNHDKWEWIVDACKAQNYPKSSTDGLIIRIEIITQLYELSPSPFYKFFWV